MPGKDPHRPQGKTDAMEWERRAHDKDLSREEIERHGPIGAPSRVPAEEAIGGSRPGVPSRVKDAIEQREARDEE